MNTKNSSKNGPSEWGEAFGGWFEFIQINGAEFDEFKKREILELQKLFPKWSDVSEYSVSADFSMLPRCYDEMEKRLGKYEWDSVEIRFYDESVSSGVLRVPPHLVDGKVNFDTDDVIPGCKAELAGWWRISYPDLIDGIHIRRMLPKDDISDRVGKILSE